MHNGKSKPHAAKATDTVRILLRKRLKHAFLKLLAHSDTVIFADEMHLGIAVTVLRRILGDREPHGSALLAISNGIGNNIYHDLAQIK